MSRLLFLILNIVFCISFAGQGLVVLEPVYDELEGLALVEKLIEDKKYTFAENAVSELNDSFLKLELQARIKNELGRTEEVVQLMNEGFELARSYYLRQEWNQCSKVRITNKDSLENSKKAILIECNFKASQFEEALKLAENNFDPRAIELKINWMLSQKLYGGILNIILNLPENSVNVELQAEWVQKLPDYEKQIAIEYLKIQFPNHKKTTMLWTEFQLKNSNTQTSLDGFRKLVQISPQFSTLVGEALRTVNNREESRYYSILSQSHQEGLKLKMNLTIDTGDWNQLVGLAGPFERSSFENENNLIYSLAYSHFVTGNAEKALDFSSELYDINLKQKFNQLIKTHR